MSVSDSKWTNAWLDKMRFAGDPLADDAVARIYADGQVDAVKRLLANLGRNDQIVPHGLPPVVRDYLDSCDDLPDWFDDERMSLGHQLFARFGPQAVLVLHCASLPNCYAAAKFQFCTIRQSL